MQKELNNNLINKYILFLFFIIKLKNININSIICNKLIIISLIFELYHIV